MLAIIRQVFIFCMLFVCATLICSITQAQQDSLFKGVLGVDTLSEITVIGEKSSMQLSLDKRIFNVGKDLANAGGSALDILMNIPAMSVDPEGNVRLRGSDNVRILIDGKPSGLVSFKGGGGLQQLPANMIERVEIITNPSARYEAEGMAGILNIILKKEKRQGFNGSFEIIGGDPANFGGAANLNYRHNKVNFFINYSVAYRKPRGTSKLYQETYHNDTINILEQNNDFVIKGLNNNIRGGIDYFFNENSVLTGSYLFRRSDANRITHLRYNDYLFNTSGKPLTSARKQDENEDEPNSEYTISYKRNFKQKGHELIAEMKYLDNWESSDQNFTHYYFNENGSEDLNKRILQHSLNDESEKQFLMQLDYVRPMFKTGKIETGFRTSFRDMTNDYIVTQKNDQGQDIPLPGLDNIFFYNENIHAVYGIVANKTQRISYQGGLRAEWTDVKTILKETNEENPRKYTNLFPSAHLTYHLPDEHDIQLSYSRRVRRPFYNDLSPFFTFSDNRNYFSGNPDLNPEFSDVIEAGHLKTFDKGSLASSIYYRYTNGKIQSIRTVNEQGNATTLPYNLNAEQAYGLELISNYSPFTWWKLDANINFFRAHIDGSNIVKAYKTSTNTWFARQTSRFSFPKYLDFQLRFNYEAPRNTVQGRQLSLTYADISASKDILRGNGTVSLNILDVFNSRWSRYVTEGINFMSRGEFQSRRRQVNVTFSYRIRQLKSAQPTKTEEN